MTTQPIALAYYTDVLCVWAHLSQVRLDEVTQNFPDDVTVDYRFCSVFGDTAFKIGKGWAERGGYEGFAHHLHEAVADFPHVQLHPELWKRDRPTSSTPAHLVMKAVQRAEPGRTREVLLELRSAFFERCLDISRWSVLEECVRAVGLETSTVRELIDGGTAHADLEADLRDQRSQMIQGSPTFLLNEGRQKLYGNVGYRVIEANIKELLRSPGAGEATWC